MTQSEEQNREIAATTELIEARISRGLRKLGLMRDRNYLTDSSGEPYRYTHLFLVDRSLLTADLLAACNRAVADQVWAIQTWAFTPGTEDVEPLVTTWGNAEFSIIPVIDMSLDGVTSEAQKRLREELSGSAIDGPANAT